MISKLYYFDPSCTG